MRVGRFPHIVVQVQNGTGLRNDAADPGGDDQDGHPAGDNEKQGEEQSDRAEPPLFFPGEIKKPDKKQGENGREVPSPVIGDQHGQTERQQKKRVRNLLRAAFPPEQPQNEADGGGGQSMVEECDLEKGEMAHFGIRYVMIDPSGLNRPCDRVEIPGVNVDQVVAAEDRSDGKAQLGGSEQSHVAGKTYSGRLEDFQRSL